MEKPTEIMTSTFHGNPNLSEHEEEDLSNRINGGGALYPPPPYANLSSFFGLLEKFAEESGNTHAGHSLRKARMSFIEAFSAQLLRQADMRGVVGYVSRNRGGRVSTSAIVMSLWGDHSMKHGPRRLQKTLHNLRLSV